MPKVHYQTGGVIEHDWDKNTHNAKFTMLCGHVFKKWDGDLMRSGAIGVPHVTCKTCLSKLEKYRV